MHIGFFTDGFTPQLNGVATNLEAVSGALRAQGHRVSIFAPRMGGYVDPQPDVYRFPSFQISQDPPHWLATPFSSHLLRILRLGLEVVHVHSPFAMQLLGWQVARVNRLPMVITYHTLIAARVENFKFLGHYTVPPRLAERYSAWTCNLCYHVVAPSEKVRAILTKFGVYRPISVIPNGMPLDRFQYRSRGYLRLRFGLGSDARILLSVGRLTLEKNGRFLIGVLARLSRTDANVFLVMVGQGRLKDEFQTLAAGLGVGDKLILTGPIRPAEIPDVYADADIYVTASFSEVHSVAAIEALASGLPLVVVPDPSFQDLVSDGENGFVAPASVDAFAARISEILSRPGLREKMSACSRVKAQEFSAEGQAHKLVSLYESLICRK